MKSCVYIIKTEVNCTAFGGVGIAKKSAGSVTVAHK